MESLQAGGPQPNLGFESPSARRALCSWQGSPALPYTTSVSFLYVTRQPQRNLNCQPLDETRSI